MIMFMWIYVYGVEDKGKKILNRDDKSNSRRGRNNSHIELQAQGKNLNRTETASKADAGWMKQVLYMTCLTETSSRYSNFRLFTARQTANASKTLQIVIESTAEFITKSHHRYKKHLRK